MPELFKTKPSEPLNRATPPPSTPPTTPLPLSRDTMVLLFFFFFHERKGKEGERGDKDKNKKGKRRPHVFIMEEMQLGYPRAEFELRSSPKLRVKRARFVYSVVSPTKHVSDQVPSGNGLPEGSVGIGNLSVHARSQLKQTLLLYSTIAEIWGGA